MENRTGSEMGTKRATPLIRPAVLPLQTNGKLKTTSPFDTITDRVPDAECIFPGVLLLNKLSIGTSPKFANSSALIFKKFSHISVY